MKKIRSTFNTKILTCLFLIFSSIYFFTSCAPRSAYFKDLPKDTMHTPRIFVLDSFSYPKVKTDDILNISIQTIDPNSNHILNEGNQAILTGAAAGNNGAQQAVQGYLVDQNGYIKMPYLDTIYVRGLTTDQITDTISKRIGFYFKDPVVLVRFANFRVTVLGLVKDPASFIMPNEKPTLFDAIGLAGDISVYGKRNNVLIMRDDDYGKKEVARIDLDSSSAMRSPYFYLRPNDVIYVEPTRNYILKNNIFQDLLIKVLQGIFVLTIVILSHRSP